MVYFQTWDGYQTRDNRIKGSQNTYFAYMGTATLWKNGTDCIYAGARLVAFTSDNLSYRTPRYYHTDALGSVRLMTKDDSTVFYSDGYQPYGQDNGKPYCPSCPTNPQLKFTGKPVSQTTGLYYDYQRWYDPTIGRFISQDPFAGHLSDPQSLNPYAYASNAPTTNIDPTGLIFENTHPSCPAIWQNPLGFFGCTLNSPAIGPDLVIDPIGLLDDADWLISHFDESGGSTGTTVTCDSCTPPRGPTPPVTDGSASVTRISVTNPTITTTVTENVGATTNLVDTSNFFVRSDILSGTFARDQLTGLTNGFGIPASRALEVGRTFVGPEGNFAESGGIGQYVRLRAYDPQLGLRVQARFDVGFVQGFGNVDRVVLETYDPVAQILLKVHLPLI